MIFILEDDDNIRKLISYSLNSQNFEIKDFALPSDLWTALENCHPDLLLLDIMLPQEDGISILKKLRSNPKTSGIPVIMLTAKDSEYDVVTGLDAGADDYVTKPFGMLPLVSRIKAVLRRYEKTDSHKELLQAGDLKIDENQHTVFYSNQQIFLTVKEEVCPLKLPFKNLTLQTCCPVRIRPVSIRLELLTSRISTLHLTASLN